MTPRKQHRGDAIAWPTPERQKAGTFQEARTYEFEPDNDGKPVRRPIRTIRADDATAANRLAKYSLTQAQIMAATLFERDYETSNLEPKLTVNLLGAGGTQHAEMPGLVLTARDRVHYAREALRLAGPNVVLVVEAMVLNGASLSAAGLNRSHHKKIGLAWAALALDIGLNMLAAHYRTKGRMAG